MTFALLVQEIWVITTDVSRPRVASIIYSEISPTTGHPFDNFFLAVFSSEAVVMWRDLVIGSAVRTRNMAPVEPVNFEGMWTLIYGSTSFNMCCNLWEAVENAFNICCRRLNSGIEHVSIFVK